VNRGLREAGDEEDPDVIELSEMSEESPGEERPERFAQILMDEAGVLEYANWVPLQIPIVVENVSADTRDLMIIPDPPQPVAIPMRHRHRENARWYEFWQVPNWVWHIVDGPYEPRVSEP
jgi:hypothetical protein